FILRVLLSEFTGPSFFSLFNFQGPRSSERLTILPHSFPSVNNFFHVFEKFFLAKDGVAGILKNFGKFSVQPTAKCDIIVAISIPCIQKITQAFFFAFRTFLHKPQNLV
ncbi:MAG: hypothetical protein J1E06_01530, partial [Acutalibacter sp.]|nr:hypothetical protein [Acutalibacter sp.]